jgi:hypothetical protein
MLRNLIRATRRVADPEVLDVRRMAESLLARKGTMPESAYETVSTRH